MTQASVDGEWVECSDCGERQQLPPPRAGHNRVCHQCKASFGDGMALPACLLALSVTIFMALIAVNAMLLMKLDVYGRINFVTLASTASGYAQHGMALLASLVFTLLVIIPLLRVGMEIVVFYNLWRDIKTNWLAPLFLWTIKLRPWAMLDVFLLAIFVTVSKLRHNAVVEFSGGLWTLIYLIMIFITLGLSYDKRRIWDIIAPPKPVADDQHHAVTCLGCGLLQAGQATEKNNQLTCERCGDDLHQRKPHSIQRTWALMLSGFMFYIPANFYPILTVVTLGREKNSTIFGGIRDLWTPADWPFAVIIFAASIVIPLLKLTGLLLFLLALHFRHTDHIMHLTRFYRLFDVIGRWSMLDVFAGALLTSLVAFDNLTSILPGPGIMPFTAVVLLTMVAVSSFDPRLLWDMAREKHD